jgi:serine protease AprX
MRRNPLILWALGALFALPGAFADDPQTLASYVRVDAAHADQLAALDLGAHRSLDYGHFLWLGVDSRQLTLLDDADLVSQRPADFTLTLGDLRFDPLVTDPRELLPEAWQAARASAEAPALHLVQLIGPTRAEWLDDLHASGLEVVRYIHPHSYVVWGRAAARDAARAADFVRWSGDFEPGYRVLAPWRQLGGEKLQVDALIYRGSDPAGVLAEIERLGGERLGYAKLDSTFGLASFRLVGDLLHEASRVPGVYSLQPVPTDGGLRSERSNQINVNNHDVGNLAFPGYPAWLTSVGLSGAGVLMANVDGGVQEDHPDLVSRMIACSGTTCSSTASSHGTHTAGIMAADGASGITDGDGFLRGLGMAPGATMVEQSYSPYYTQAGGMLLLMSDSAANGAVLSGNSWGPAGSPRGYDNDTMQVDIGVRDTDSLTPGHQAFTYVLSFMNGGGGTSTQGTPDEAKNLFNIGSTKMLNSLNAPNPNINDLSSNSAHGPALDGRTIPHMVAPGCYVDSTVTTNSHGLKCGTSMASPHVSGAVALFFEYYRALTAGEDPSPALVKAAFLPVAHNLEGFDDADGSTLGPPFDNKQGWGRMDISAVVDPQQNVTYVEQETVFDNTGEAWERQFAIDPAQPTRLMLVWTDAPGHGLGGSTAAWNNDLDLEVDAGGSTYLGNVFAAGGLSTTGGTADLKNNTEGVFLPAASGATITVRVLASNITSDALPGLGDATDQDFALVCYGCLDSADADDMFADGFESGDTKAWTATVED